MTYPQIAHFIKTTRKAKGWSQDKLAELANLHRPHLTNIENGLVHPDYTTIKTIVEKLGGQIKIVPPIDQDEAEIIEEITR